MKKRLVVGALLLALLVVGVNAAEVHEHQGQISISGLEHPDLVNRNLSLYHWTMTHWQLTEAELGFNLHLSPAGVHIVFVDGQNFKAEYNALLEKRNALEPDQFDQAYAELVRRMYRRYAIELPPADKQALDVELDSFKWHITASAHSPLLDPGVSEQFLRERSMYSSLVPQGPPPNECAGSGAVQMCTYYSFAWSTAKTAGAWNTPLSGLTGTAPIGFTATVGAWHNTRIETFPYTGGGASGKDVIAYLTAGNSTNHGCATVRLLAIEQVANGSAAGPGINIPPTAGAESYYAAQWSYVSSTEALVSLIEENAGIPHTLGTFTYSGYGANDRLSVCKDESGHLQVDVLVWNAGHPNVYHKAIAATNTDLPAGFPGIVGNAAANSNVVLRWFGATADITTQATVSVSGYATCTGGGQACQFINHNPAAVIGGQTYSGPIGNPTQFISFQQSANFTDSQLLGGTEINPGGFVFCSAVGYIFNQPKIPLQHQTQMFVEATWVAQSVTPPPTGNPGTFTYTFGAYCNGNTYPPDFGEGIAVSQGTAAKGTWTYTVYNDPAGGSMVYADVTALTCGRDVPLAMPKGSNIPWDCTLPLSLGLGLDVVAELDAAPVLSDCYCDNWDKGNPALVYWVFPGT